MSGTQFVNDIQSPSFLPDAVLNVPLKINAQAVLVLAAGTLVIVSPEGITKTFTFTSDHLTHTYPIRLDVQVRVVATGTDLDLDDELILLA